MHILPLTNLKLEIQQLKKLDYWNFGWLHLLTFHIGGGTGNVSTNWETRITRCNSLIVLNILVSLDHRLCTIYLEVRIRLISENQVSGLSLLHKWLQLYFVYIGISDGIGASSLVQRKKQDSWEIKWFSQKDSTTPACYSTPSSDFGGSLVFSQSNKMSSLIPSIF